MSKVRPNDITASVIASFENCGEERLTQLMTALVRHLHAFADEVGLTPGEWTAAIAALTATGHITDERRQEFILWSDTLGVSMVVDALDHDFPEGATESTVLGPFYVPGSPERAYGASIVEDATAGVPVWVHGRVRALDGTPIAAAEVDVWQNDENMLYAVQSPEMSENHLRGRFRTGEDGRYAFVGVRPVPYPIPDDGPVGSMLGAAGRHPWRPAHIHMIVRAPGYRTLTTHIFDAASEYLDGDAVFAVKPSLLREFVRHDPTSPQTPAGVSTEWYAVENDIVLAPGAADEPEDAGRTA
jgi:protocatechuate 3,4-dioxygenase beta subunit